MMKEAWKDVKGFEEYYKVSNFGRVISKKFIGLSISAVSRVAAKTITRGKYYNKTAGGYHWKPVH